MQLTIGTILSIAHCLLQIEHPSSTKKISTAAAVGGSTKNVL
jgi:hypothetical protein